jgi:hypothetical protein
MRFTESKSLQAKKAHTPVLLFILQKHMEFTKTAEKGGRKLSVRRICQCEAEIPCRRKGGVGIKHGVLRMADGEWILAAVPTAHWLPCILFRVSQSRRFVYLLMMYTFSLLL